MRVELNVRFIKCIELRAASHFPSRLHRPSLTCTCGFGRIDTASENLQVTIPEKEWAPIAKCLLSTHGCLHQECLKSPQEADSLNQEKHQGAETHSCKLDCPLAMAGQETSRKGCKTRQMEVTQGRSLSPGMPRGAAQHRD